MSGWVSIQSLADSTDIRYSLVKATETAVSMHEGGYFALHVGGMISESAELPNIIDGKPAYGVIQNPSSGGSDSLVAGYEDFSDSFSIHPPFDPWLNTERDLGPSSPQGTPGGIGSVGNGGPGQKPQPGSNLDRGHVSDQTLQSDLRQIVDRDTLTSRAQTATIQASSDQAVTNGSQKGGVDVDGLAREARDRLNLKNIAAKTPTDTDAVAFQQQAITQSIKLQGNDEFVGRTFPQAGGRSQPLPLIVDLGAAEQHLDLPAEGGAVDVATAVGQTQQAHEDRMYAAVAAVLEEHGVADTPAPPNQLPLEGELARAMALEMVFDEAESAFAPASDNSQIDVKALAAPPEGVPVSNVDKGRESDETSLLGSAPGPVMLRAAVGAAIVAWHRRTRLEDQQEPPRHSRFSPTL